MKNQKEEKTTFTKSILALIMLLYFLGAILGGILVVFSAGLNFRLGMQVDSSMFIAFASYIGGPTATAIGFYAWKSKAENILKISNSNEISKKVISETSVETLLANMKGEEI